MRCSMRFPASLFLSLPLFALVIAAPSARAASAVEIRAGYEDALDQLKTQVPGAADTLAKARGILVIPGMWKAGIGLGGEYGQGVLTINGDVSEYYSLLGLSLGWQVGIQKRDIILLFMDDTVLTRFRADEGWEFGLDASAALITVGIDGDITTLTHNKPILGFVIDQKGLMGNLTLEGYKLTKIKK